MKKMKIFKKLVSLAMAASMAATLAACGSKDQDAAAPSDENVTEITFWNSMDTTYGEILNGQIETFNETIGAEKGIHVTSVFQNYPGTESLTAAMSSDDVENMPDVIQLYTESIAVVRDYERTVWAEDMLADDSSFSKDELIDNVRKSFEINGRLIGMPYNIASYLLYYNNDQLKQAGFDAPPKTIAEMAKMLPVLAEKTNADYGLNTEVRMNELLAFVEQIGAEGTAFGNNNNGHDGYMDALSCAEDGSLENFINAWSEVVDSGAYKATKDSINEEFAAEMYSMVIMSSSRLKTVEDLVGDAFDWQVAPVPTVNEGDAQGSFPTGSGLFVLDRDDDKKVEAAWEFVKYMASADVQAQWVETTGYVPANKAALQSDTYKNAVAENPRLQVAYDVLANAPENMTSPLVPNNSEVDTVIKDSMIQFGEGSADAQTTLESIVSGVNQIFADYYRANAK